jgi:GMP synthase-like glutamine amidotransferase
LLTFIDHRHNAVGRTPLEEGSARRKDLNLKKHNIHQREISMLPAGFEAAIPTSERTQTHALDHAATRIGGLFIVM